MEEEGIVGLRVLNEPTHSADDVVPCRLHDGVGLVVGQDDHVLSLVAVPLDEEGRDVVDIVDAAAQLAILAKVVDADEQSLATAGTVGVLESIAFGGTVAELLGNRRRGRTGASVRRVVGLLERMAVGVEMLRRAVGGSLILVISAAAAPVLRRRSRRRAIPGGRRAGRRSVAAAAVATTSSSVATSLVTTTTSVTTSLVTTTSSISTAASITAAAASITTTAAFVSSAASVMALPVVALAGIVGHDCWKGTLEQPCYRGERDWCGVEVETGAVRAPWELVVTGWPVGVRSRQYVRRTS